VPNEDEVRWWGCLTVCTLVAVTLLLCSLLVTEPTQTLLQAQLHSQPDQPTPTLLDAQQHFPPDWPTQTLRGWAETFSPFLWDRAKPDTPSVHLRFLPRLRTTGAAATGDTYILPFLPSFLVLMPPPHTPLSGANG
jgi:hypothetical protein